MGIRIHTSREDTAIIYCSTTNWAFGPVFESTEQAEAFIQFCEAMRPGIDLRRFEDYELKEIHLDFLRKFARSGGADSTESI